MAGIRQGVDDFGFDVSGALAQYDDPASQEKRLFFHIVSHQQRGEARPLPQRHELRPRSP